MSKRGYNSNSRYNPNKISSYCIKIINYLRKNELLEFFPGFLDLRKKKSRLSRIKAKDKLINEFKKVKLNKSYSIHHQKREFVYLYQNNVKREYNDNFKTHELREILKIYNKIIQKSLFDICKCSCYRISRNSYRSAITITRGVPTRCRISQPEIQAIIRFE